MEGGPAAHRGPAAFGLTASELDCRREETGVTCEQRLVFAGLFRSRKRLEAVEALRFEADWTRRRHPVLTSSRGEMSLWGVRQAAERNQSIERFLADPNGRPVAFSESDFSGWLVLVGTLGVVGLAASLPGLTRFFRRLVSPPFIELDEVARRVRFRPRAGRREVCVLGFDEVAGVSLFRDDGQTDGWPQPPADGLRGALRTKGLMHLRFELKNQRSHVLWNGGFLLEPAVAQLRADVANALGLP